MCLDIDYRFYMGWGGGGRYLCFCTNDIYIATDVTMLLDFTEQINNYIISQMLSEFIPNLILKTKNSINPNGFSNLLYVLFQTY